MTLTNYLGVPGMGSAVVSTENSFLWGSNAWYTLKSVVISSACVDSGSSPTTDLRPGLVLGKITSGGEYTAYAATNTDGSQVAEGILFTGVRMLSPISGSAEDKLGQLVVAGPVKGGSLYGIDQFARANLFGRVVFDDDLVGNRFGWRDVVAKTADYTVVTADRDTIFTNRGAAGAVNFTLPAIAKGLKYLFYCEAAQDLTITAATADTLVAFNDLAADSVTIDQNTNSKQIGGALMVVANDNASKWLVIPHMWNVADTASLTQFTLAT